MSEIEYQRILSNQVILDNKLDSLIKELKTIKNLVNTAINNQQILEQNVSDITNRLKRIENK